MTMGAKYKAVFFDADDTLFDYPRAERAALRACLREFRIRIDLGPFLDAYRRHNRDVWQAFERGETDQAALARRALPPPGRRARHCRTCPWTGSAPSTSRPCPASRSCFREPWRRSGRWPRNIPLALVTNGIASVQRRRFAASPITPYFQAVVISEEVGIAKPDPRIFAPALREIGVAAGDVLYVGDSVTSDMAAARNAGMDFCWFNPAGAPVPAGQRRDSSSPTSRSWPTF